MPVIYGETSRDVKLLPALSAQQAVELLATGAVAWLSLRAPAPEWARTLLTAGVTVGGTVYAIGRWPLGSNGERVPVWLRRAIGFALGPHTLKGTSVPGWDGIHSIRRGRIRHAAGWSAVMDWSGGDPLLRGPEAAAAAQVIYRELLHAIPGSVQVVGTVRTVTQEDRPPTWSPERACPSLAALARAYAEHWDGWVQARALAVRRTYVVVTVRGPRAEALPNLDVATSAVANCAARLGLTARPVQGAELIALLRAESAAADVRPVLNDADAPLAVRLHV